MVTVIPLGSIQCKVVISMLLLYSSSMILHYTSSTCPGFLCELLCNYFWSSIEDLAGLEVRIFQDSFINSIEYTNT